MTVLNQKNDRYRLLEDIRQSLSMEVFGYSDYCFRSPSDVLKLENKRNAAHLTGIDLTCLIWNELVMTVKIAYLAGRYMVRQYIKYK